MEDGAECDKAAIVKVIEAETAAYFNKDFAAWARCWVQTPHVRHWGWYPHSGIQVLDGWEANSEYMRRSMEQYPSPNYSAAEVRRERMTVRIGVDMAWVTFDQHAPRTGDPFDVAGLQHNMRILEKQDGVWKIACVTCLYPFFEAVNYPLLRVDERATVLWANAAARERLRENGLTISAGRLRASERAANQGLQAWIRWAAGAVGYMGGQAAWSAVSSTGGALPVVLSDPDTGAVRICWVTAEGGMILVSFDDGHRTERRLSAASVIYRLSPGQMRLATLVVDGHDLSSAADLLGISINTARTHLQRMFDKTGVRSQPALVRVLLSAVAPVA